MGKPKRGDFSPEVRERAMRLVREQRDQYPSQWAAISAIAPKLGMTKETLRRWLRQAERDAGTRPGPTSADAQRLRELEREVKELRRANEILRKASAYFAQAELDRRSP
jgi:transposase-like protein